jgi:ribosomal protein S27AE
MRKSKTWDDLFAEASEEVRRWRREHKKATLTEIEDTVDSELAKMRARMIQDMALASELANLDEVSIEERPRCPRCGEPLSANGRQERQLVTEYEEAITLTRSKGVCPHCGASSFPPR